MARRFHRNLLCAALAIFAGVTMAISMPAHANDGHWIGLVHEETESDECLAYADAAIQAAARNNQFYGWAQVGDTWHRVTGRINSHGVLSGHVSSADAMDPENTPFRSLSALSFKMQIDGTVAEGHWSAPDGCSGKITAYQP